MVWKEYSTVYPCLKKPSSYFWDVTEKAFICLKSTLETIENGVKYVHIWIHESWWSYFFPRKNTSQFFPGEIYVTGLRFFIIW